MDEPIVWRPIFEMCAPCSRQVEYDFFIKLENLALEQKYFVEKIEISKNIRPFWENKNSANNYSTSEIRDQYYNMLTENEIWQLYSFYQMDFNLFEYEVD